MSSKVKQELPPGDTKAEMPVKNENVETGSSDASDSDEWSDNDDSQQSDVEMENLQTHTLIPIQTSVDMGENIWRTTGTQFSVPYEEGKKKKIFDDGLEGDEIDDNDEETDTDGSSIGVMDDKLMVDDELADSETHSADEDTTTNPVSSSNDEDDQSKLEDADEVEENSGEESEEESDEGPKEDNENPDSDSDSDVDRTFDENQLESETIYTNPQTIGHGSDDACNFRCEASVTKRKEAIVEFWPIKSPEPKSGKETTWGEQYSELYRLAIMAARYGSHAAYEMLLALPDINQGFSGGWLFDYKFEPTLKDHPVISRRWVFRSAHLIDGNSTREAKASRVKPMVWPVKKKGPVLPSIIEPSDD